MRRTISTSSRSLKANGASRALLSSVSETSAMLRAGRSALPAKITSSISPPRSRLAEVSPITQRSASTRFDLPQPLGPTMPVRPGPTVSSIASTNDLKPTRRSRSICISYLCRRHSLARDGERIRAEGSPATTASRLRRKVRQDFVELFGSRRAGELAAVDEECRRRIDIEFLRRNQALLDDPVFQRDVVEAGLKFVLAHAAELGEPGQRFPIILRRCPLVLRCEEGVGKGVKAIRRRTARDHCGAQSRPVERKVAQD